MQRFVVAVGGEGYRIDGNFLDRGNFLASLKQCFAFFEAVGAGDGQGVIAINVAILHRGKGMHGVFDGKSADKQSHAPHDSEYRHEEALLVAKQVACRYLI